MDTRLARWSPLSGIVFVVLFVVAGVLFDGNPDPGATDASIVAYYGDDGNQLKLELAFLLATIAGVFFVWFAGTLAGRMRAAEGEPGWLSQVASISAGAFVAVMVVASAVYQFVADAVDLDVLPRFAAELPVGAVAFGELDQASAAIATHGEHGVHHHVNRETGLRQHHAEGVSDQQALDARVLEQRGEARVVAGQHGDARAFRAHALQPWKVDPAHA